MKGGAPLPPQVLVTQREPEEPDPDARRAVISLWAELLALAVAARQEPVPGEQSGAGGEQPRDRAHP